MTSTLTRDRMVADLAGMLDLPAAELTEDTNLLDLGLDSVRLMSLVERWRAEGAVVDFVDLASDPQLGAWFEVVGAS
ncbi:phosphopantetheine-binding protein [Rhodococcus sp. NPDC003318]|uniref:phosphopantetheine-binding protein n=1 Tax=Rhodococcus sp. NPDC003318 TaxID=3364503 RepID=UPI00369C6DC5